MDSYGFEIALRVSLEMFDMGGKRSGRTEVLLNHVKDGDMILSNTPIEVNRLRLLLKERGKKVDVFFAPPEHMWQFTKRAKGRCYFDHNWIKQWYMEAMINAGRDLRSLEKTLSADLNANDPLDHSPVNNTKFDDIFRYADKEPDSDK